MAKYRIANTPRFPYDPSMASIQKSNLKKIIDHITSLDPGSIPSEFFIELRNNRSEFKLSDPTRSWVMEVYDETSPPAVFADAYVEQTVIRTNFFDTASGATISSQVCVNRTDL